MSYLDREPGMHDADGSAFALVEQQRMNVMDYLRDSKAVSVTMECRDGDFLHWGVYIADGDAETFITYAAVRALRDMMGALGVGAEECCRVILAAIDEGVGT